METRTPSSARCRLETGPLNGRGFQPRRPARCWTEQLSGGAALQRCDLNSKSGSTRLQSFRHAKKKCGLQPPRNTAKEFRRRRPRNRGRAALQRRVSPASRNLPSRTAPPTEGAPSLASFAKGGIPRSSPSRDSDLQLRPRDPRRVLLRHPVIPNPAPSPMSNLLF